MPSGGRLLGLDIGTVTIGAALCDARWTIASPATPLKRAKFAADKTALAALLAREDVRGIVVGLPLSLDGKDTPRTQATRAYAHNLGVLGLPLLLWDERWSTAAVERQMIAADVSRARRAAQVDSAAAAYILQGAIDRLASG